MVVAPKIPRHGRENIKAQSKLSHNMQMVNHRWWFDGLDQDLLIGGYGWHSNGRVRGRLDGSSGLTFGILGARDRYERQAGESENDTTRNQVISKSKDRSHSGRLVLSLCRD